jgi:hypothetical protein
MCCSPDEKPLSTSDRHAAMKLSDAGLALVILEGTKCLAYGRSALDRVDDELLDQRMDHVVQEDCDECRWCFERVLQLECPSLNEIILYSESFPETGSFGAELRKHIKGCAVCTRTISSRIAGLKTLVDSE